MLKDFFDNESDPIVSLEMFYGPKKHLVEKCIVTFSSVIYEHILQQYECSKIAEIGSCGDSRPVWSFDCKGEQIAFYLTPIGSALAGGTIAEVNHLTGASRFIVSGSCGSLDREKTEGRFIVPTQAYRGEGLSYYFAEARDYIDIKNADLISGIFTEMKIPFVNGKTWTTDSMLRETVNLVNKRKEEGCIAVEMEFAGIQAVCDFYGFEFYGFLAAGDVLAEGDYDIAELDDANHNLDKFRIALEIARRI